MGYVDLRKTNPRVEHGTESDDRISVEESSAKTRSDRKRKTSPIRAAIKRAVDHPLADYGFLFSAITILVVLGLVMVLSASNVLSYQQNDGNGYVIFIKQAIVAVLGFGLMLFASRLNPKIYRQFAGVAMIVAFVLLVLVLIPGIGSGVHGQRNWIELGGPFRLQPSEFAKFAMVVWAAKLLTDRHDKIEGWRSLLIPFAPVTGAMIVLIVLEGDLGTAMILMAIMAGMLFVAGAPPKVFVAMGAMVLMAILMLSLAAPYRMQRFMTWLDPGSDPTGAGWQIIHGHYALATGGWWGVGLGGSREKWGFLPEAQTDFILAVLGEELGIVGTLTTLALFGTITFFIIRIAMRSTDRFVQLTTAGVGLWIIAQALMNVGAVLGALPIAGVPLPLVSNGGSSLAVTLGAFGMILAFARAEPQAAAYIEQKQASERESRRIRFGLPASERKKQNKRRRPQEQGRGRTRSQGSAPSRRQARAQAREESRPKGSGQSRGIRSSRRRKAGTKK